MTITVTMLFWLWVTTLVVGGVGAAILVHWINGLYTVRHEDFSRYWGYVTDINNQSQNLATRVDKWEDAQDNIETTLDDHGREIDHRIAVLGKELGVRIDKSQQDMIRLIAEGDKFQQEHTDGLVSSCLKDGSLVEEIEKTLKDGEARLLQLAHMSVWNDLDGTLTTMRADFDASLNQRTKSINKYVAEQIATLSTAVPNEELVTDLNGAVIALTEKVSSLEKDGKNWLWNDDRLSEKINEVDTTVSLLSKDFDNFKDDTDERVSKIELEVSEIQDDIVDVILEGDEPEPKHSQIPDWMQAPKPPETSLDARFDEYMKAVGNFKDDILKKFGEEAVKPENIAKLLSRFLKK